MTREDRNNAAVSETVGYILLLAIVTLSMGVIYAGGYPILQSNIDATIFESAEQSFVVLQSNMKKVSYDQTPVKILKVKLQSNTLSVDSDSSITINYDSDTILCPAGKIEFSKDKKTITYEMGGVFKKYPPHAMTMVSKPPIYIDTVNGIEMTTIGVISVKGDNSISGRGISSIIMEHNSSTMTMSPGITNVTVQVNSTHAQSWENYLKDTGFDIINSTDSTVIAMKNETLLTVSEHIVDVNIT